MKEKSILPYFSLERCPSEFHRVIYQRTRRELITPSLFTYNLYQMHITLSKVQSINCDHTITIYQDGCQAEQIRRLELVMMSSNTFNRSFKSLVHVHLCVCVCDRVGKRFFFIHSLHVPCNHVFKQLLDI